MSYVLAIGNTVDVPVRFTVKDKGEEKEFKFTLFCERLEADEVSKAMSEKSAPIKDFLERVVKGWEGQRLVRDEAEQPVAFSEDAFKCMLRVAGTPVVILNAYLKEVGAKSKN